MATNSHEKREELNEFARLQQKARCWDYVMKHGVLTNEAGWQIRLHVGGSPKKETLLQVIEALSYMEEDLG